MGWREQLRRASFRNVPFFVDSADGEVGRRVELVHVAGTGDVIAQELGPEARSFTVTAYVIGPDYMTQRERLEDALVAEGAGTLVLPWRGELQAVVAGKVKISESKSDGGMARFTIPFVETVLTLTPIVTDDSRSQLATAATAATAAATAGVESRFDATKLTVTSRASLEADIAKAAQAVASVESKMGGISTGSSQAATKALAIVNNVSSLVLAPSTLASSSVDLVKAVYSSARDFGESTLRVVGDSVLWAASAISLLSPSRDVVESVMRSAEVQDFGLGGATDECRLSMDVLLRVASAAEAASVLSTLPFESYDQAIDVAARSVAVLDDLDLVADDATFAEVGKLRAALVDHLSRVASALPELRTWVVPSPMSALLTAHLVWGDATREAEIIARNRDAVTHPGIIEQGSVLTVLGA